MKYESYLEEQLITRKKQANEHYTYCRGRSAREKRATA